MFSIIFPPSVVGLITSLSLLATTLAAAVFLLPGIVLKLVPHYPLQRACSRYCVWVAINWVSAHQLVFRLRNAAQRQNDIRPPLDPAPKTTLVSNHQTWADTQQRYPY